MNKKEQKGIKRKIENAPKNKYIYQRYGGIITKYIDYENYYINCETGIVTKKNKHLMLGKVSENIIDLVEIGDVVEIFDVLHQDIFYIWSEEMLKALKEDIENGIQIRTILTKELYEANCYVVGGEDE